MRKNPDGNIIQDTEFLLGKDLGHGAVKEYPAVFQAHEPGCIQGGQIAVVHGHEHAGPGGPAALQQIKKFHHAGQIQTGGQLVQQEQRALLGQSPRQQHPLQFPAGKLPHAARGQSGGSGGGQGLSDGGVVPPSVAAQPGKVGIAPQQDHLTHTQAGRTFRALRHHGRQPGAFARTQAIQRPVRQTYAAALGPQHAGNATQQGGFAAAVRSQQGHAFAAARCQAHAAQHGPPGIARREIAHVQHRPFHCSAQRPVH